MQFVSALKRAMRSLRQQQPVEERHELAQAHEKAGTTASAQSATLWALATPAQRKVLWAQATPAERRTHWAQLAPGVRTELRRRMHGDRLSVQAALNQLCEELWGSDVSPQWRRHFFLLAAPIARAVALEGAQPEDRFHDTEHTVSEATPWMRWLDAFDPLAARMIDLRYVAGLSIKEVGMALKLPPASVARELRQYRELARLNIDATPPESGLPNKLISEVSLA